MLYIKDFCKQTVVSNDQIKTAIAKVPNAHLKGLQYIVYDPERFFQRSYVNPRPINYNVIGQYNRLPSKFITIHKIIHEENFYHVLYHEIGHHVFNHILPSRMRVTWVNDIFPNSQYFVSNYASTNAQEDFCESYSSFYTNASDLKKDTRKASFVRHCMTHII
ncbi:hypothetical protein PSECIP111951_00302 [Pseudoalteromonas holothuriae]|uniref:Uncharacterized protein n=1 Tax=Pseudoalteromonas holothuriae TaxID=2963714 RepID=A0A9W4R0H4_9GAMM|nr:MULTISPECIES: hypothetical protein [unclassified Pseudoalteromonas]CAH9050971.1 hypothetical protein PSECIP111951_00302 [Pseudoalteromonas sp. CIP111951]CAH9061632.1 hypothetical protein PSECIP111854_02850 [Pseudoalteromonas sp. CIP111854]